MVPDDATLDQSDPQAAEGSVAGDAGPGDPTSDHDDVEDALLEFVERRGAVTVLTVNRPDKLNAFNTQMMKDMIAAFDVTVADAVRAAAAAMAGLGTGLYVERMVQGGVAELIVGITRDPLFGPVMTLGTGGVLVELLKDSATLLLPSSRAEIECALRGLKMFPLLDGFRGRPKADLDAAIASYNGALLDALREVADAGASLQSLDRQQAQQAQRGYNHLRADAGGEFLAAGEDVCPVAQVQADRLRVRRIERGQVHRV